MDKDKRVFMYVNIDAIHSPNNYYVEGAKEDNLETHAAVLRYVDSWLEPLFDMLRERAKTFVFACSDHGYVLWRRWLSFPLFITRNSLYCTVQTFLFIKKSSCRAKRDIS
ncbi:MAG: sulfatase-like hydrolase/transferase [Prevotellaceae bacterium]|nr:sulfatase-like hydrolase/transferase [Prevotellaceae bacterium]